MDNKNLTAYKCLKRGLIKKCPKCNKKDFELVIQLFGCCMECHVNKKQGTKTMPKFYISFGQVHTHECSGYTLDKNVILVLEAGSHDEAYRKAMEMFNAKFAFVYDDPPDMSFFPGGMVGDIQMIYSFGSRVSPGLTQISLKRSLQRATKLLREDAKFERRWAENNVLSILKANSLLYIFVNALSTNVPFKREVNAVIKSQKLGIFEVQTEEGN